MSDDLSGEERPRAIGYGVVQTKLHNVVDAIKNQVRRGEGNRSGDRWAELHAHHPQLPGILSGLVAVSRATFEAAIHLCIDKHSQPLAHFVAAPPLTRTLLDALFSVVFIFERPEERTQWYVESGWLDAVRKFQRFERRHENDPALRDYLDGFRAEVDAHRGDLEPPSFVKIDQFLYWPNPGGMLRRRLASGRSPFVDQNRRDLLRQLKDSYYGDLSGDSHLGYMGVVRRGAPLQIEIDSGPYRQLVMRGLLGTYLALVSQVVIELRLGFQATMLLEIWKHFIDAKEEIADIYALYEEPLRNIAVPGEE